MPDQFKAPKGSPAKVDYHKAQLQKLFLRAGDPQFFELMWAIDALRTGNPELAAKYLSFPPGAADQSRTSGFLIHEWETETLLIQLMLTTPEQLKEDRPGFDCKSFGDVAKLVNRLRKLEDVESAVYLRSEDLTVFDEMHRIGQRQFHWQRGYLNAPQFYRYSYLYAQGKCGEYFQQKYGFPITEFNFMAFALFSQFKGTAWVRRAIALPEIGLTQELVQHALPLMLISVDEARKETLSLVEQMNEKHGSPIPTAYLPSIMRRFPLVSLKNDSDTFIAPIPELLLMRVTSGLYYDVASGGQALLNEANDRFEQYVADYIEALMARFKTRRAYPYEPKKGSGYETPDVLVQDGERIALLIECKATKLNYLAQFADDPFEAETKQYLQIANGVFQLWRFCSHARLGLLKEPVDGETAIMVVTLDSFLVMNEKLRARILKEAHELANKDEGIAAEDRRPVIFCPITGLEEVVSRTDEDRFLHSLNAARAEKYFAWEFANVTRQEFEGKPAIEKKFPFKLDELLPWWKRLDEIKQPKDDTVLSA